MIGKTIATVVATAFIACACSNPSPRTYEEIASEMSALEDRIYSDSTLTEEQMDNIVFSEYEKLYFEHENDTADIDIFITLAAFYWDLETAEKYFEEAPDYVKSDESVITKLQYRRNQQNVAPGEKFIDVCGPTVLTGDSLSIKSMISPDKPLLVDFWASWCAPCRREIMDRLIPLSQTGKVNILGIAVREDSIEDTEKAMENYGITWPVIFRGEAEGGPMFDYGIVGIPTLVLIDSDGTILDRAFSIENMDYFKQPDSIK